MTGCAWRWNARSRGWRSGWRAARGAQRIDKPGRPAGRSRPCAAPLRRPGRTHEAAALLRSARRSCAQHEALQLECLLAGGDDYELLFADPSDRDTVSALAARAGCGVTASERLGAAGTPLEVVDADGRRWYRLGLLRPFPQPVILSR